MTTEQNIYATFNIKLKEILQGFRKKILKNRLMRPFLTKIAAEVKKYPKKPKILTLSGPNSTKKTLAICNIFFS